MVRIAAMVGALALAGTAQAQTVNLAPTYRWQDVDPRPCNFFEHGGGIADLCSARQVAANRKAVGELIASGKCDEALKAALATGDLDFAREVRDFCAANGQAPPTPK